MKLRSAICHLVSLLVTAAFAQEVPVNPNIRHTHHHHGGIQDLSEVQLAAGMLPVRLLDQRVLKSQFRKRREIPIGGPEILHPVVEADRGNPRIVDHQ